MNEHDFPLNGWAAISATGQVFIYFGDYAERYATRSVEDYGGKKFSVIVYKVETTKPE